MKADPWCCLAEDVTAILEKHRDGRAWEDIAAEAGISERRLRAIRHESKTVEWGLADRLCIAVGQFPPEPIKVNARHHARQVTRTFVEVEEKEEVYEYYNRVAGTGRKSWYAKDGSHQQSQE